MTAVPRYHTPRDTRYRTLGGKAAKLAAMLGRPLMPWQRQAADVILEVDERGRFRYKSVVISVPRQSGKTTMTLILGLHRLLTTPHGKVWYTAQTGQSARERFLKDLVPLAEKTIPGALTVKRGAGDTRMDFTAIGSQMRPHPPNDKYLHGEQSDLNLIDEPWVFSEVQGDALMQAIVPTQNTRPNAQTVYLSTMGDANSAWWHDIVDRARAGDDPETAIFDWGLPDSADPTDVDAVIRSHPAVGHTIEATAIVSAAAKMKPSEFARAYANRRTATRASVFSADELAAVLTDGDAIADASEITLAAAVSWDRTRSVIAAAGYTDTGRPVAEIVDARPGTAWLPARLTELHRSHNPRAIWVDSHSPAAAIAATPGLSEIITAPSPRDVAAATGSFLDHMRAGSMSLRRDSELSESLASLVIREVGDLGAMFSRRNSAGSIAPLEAVMLALGALGLSDAPAPAPLIWTGAA